MRARVIALSITLLVLPAGALLAETSGTWQDERFAIEWELVQQDGGDHITGAVVNQSEEAVTDIEILIEELDQSGRPLKRKAALVDGDLPAGESTTFEAAVDPAASYRVTVSSYNLVLGASR